MRRLSLISFLFYVSATAWGQAGTTAITAQVLDSNGSVYANCQWSVVFVGQNTVPGAGPYAPASLLNGQQGTCDSQGNINGLTLADNVNTVTPLPSQWSFSICSGPGYAGGPYCKSNILITITGATQTITSTLQLVMPLLPVLNGGCLNAVCASISANNTFTGINAIVRSGVFTNTQQNNNFYSAIGGINPATWYSTQQGGNFATDAVAGGVSIPSSVAVHQANGIAGYVSNGCNSASGAVCNGVALYGASGANANGSSNWGINLITYSGASTTGTWQLNEFDTNVITGSVPTTIEGLQFNGVGAGTMPSAFPVNSTTLAGASVIDIWSPFLTVGGSAYQWPLGINFRRSSVNGVAVQIDGKCRTGNCTSAQLCFTAYNPSAVTGCLNAESGGNVIASAPLASGGTQATITGTGACATHDTQAGGAFAGNVRCTSGTAASTIIITPGTTAPNGWSCYGSDNTSGHELAGAQTGGSQTNCTLKFSSVTLNDFINFGAIAF